MNIRKDLHNILILSAVCLSGYVAGCGGTDGGPGKDPGYRDGIFVGGDDSTGGVTLDLEDGQLEVGSTTGFQVAVRSSSGAPVQDMTVACDTEKGIAILEPASGYALTNDSGVMSGEIGCAQAGSFRMGCRASVGGNRRTFASLKCTGEAPSGFAGFPGAGGGGLGGGGQSSTAGNVSITSVSFADNGQLGTGTSASSVDIQQDANCDGDAATNDFEPFFDTYVEVSVLNKLLEPVQFSRLRYSVNNVDGQNTPFTSEEIRFTQTAAAGDGAGGTKTIISVPVFKALNGRKYVGTPPGPGSIEISEQGFRTVEITIFGTTSLGDIVELDAQATASFSNFDRCP